MNTKNTIKIFLGLFLMIGFLTQNVYAQHTDTHAEDTHSKDTHKKSEKFTYNVLAEMHYNDAVYENSSVGQGEFDFHELHFKAGYKFNKYFKVKSALEIEHVFDEHYNGGDVFFKQAYLDYHKTSKFGFKAGLVNVPVNGSKSKVYSGVEIAPVEKYVSYAWRELGVLFYGELSEKLSYQAGVTTGLEASEISNKYGIYYARNSHLFSSVNNLAASAQVSYKLNDLFTVGSSAVFSGLESNQDYEDELDGARYSLFEGFVSYKKAGFTSRVVGVYSTISESDKINHTLHAHIGSAQYGSMVEATYDFLYDPHHGAHAKHLIVYGRAEAYDTQFRTVGFAADSKYERYEYTLGLLYTPFERVEVKTDFQFLRSGGDKQQGQLNLALVYHL